MYCTMNVHVHTYTHHTHTVNHRLLRSMEVAMDGNTIPKQIVETTS